MTERQIETISEASYYWEKGMLKNLLNKGFINKTEYEELCVIIEKEYLKKELCLNS